MYLNVFPSGIGGNDLGVLENLASATPTQPTNNINSFTDKSIDRLNSQVEVCMKINLIELQPFLKSQSNEDKLLLHWFNGLCHGTYLEMGALDGIRYSNSHVFNQRFNWTGVLIEANPNSFKKLEQNRPHELSRVHAAVCSQRQTVHFVQNGNVETTGIWEFATESFRQTFWPKVKIENTQPVECVPLREILQTSVPDQFFFDFFSLDVEGAEYEVLTSLNFSAVTFGIIIVEASDKTKNANVRKVLDENGYHYLGNDRRNDWFMNSKIQSMYLNVFPSGIGGNDLGVLEKFEKTAASATLTQPTDKSFNMISVP